MKLTEAKIKQLIKEMMEDKPLPHLDKLAGMFAGPPEDGMHALSLIAMFDEYSFHREPRHSTTDDRLMINLRFNNSSVGRQVYDALISKGVEPNSSDPKSGVSAYFTTGMSPERKGSNINLYYKLNRDKSVEGFYEI